MRIFIVIPHVFNPAGNDRYGSTKPDPQPRITALTQSLRNLYTIYAGAQEYWYRSGDRLHPQPANQQSNIELTVVICTCNELHLLKQLVLPPDLFVHRPIDCEPMLLGFACHDLLRDALGDYDLYGYMEDDLILHDPSFFAKLRYIQQQTGPAVVVQPNRYERYGSPAELKKVYIDFEFQPPAPEAAGARPPIIIESLGQTIALTTTSNYHAGCFFLSNEQMALWAAQPYFGRRDTSYIGPLESAATLGLIRTFQVYKAAPHNANFFEIEHAGQQWSRQLRAVRFPVR